MIMAKAESTICAIEPAELRVLLSAAAQ
jgi:hypothetical protein